MAMSVHDLAHPLEEVDHPEQVLAIGYFDGVHIGHQKVIGSALAMAEKLSLPAGVMTFHPHPRAVLGKEGYASYLTPLSEKLRQLEKLGVDHTYVVSFTRDFAAMIPEEFIESFLMRLRPKGVVVGFDYTFGHRAMGTAKTLREHCRDRYMLEVVDPVTLEGEKVSSTLVREMLHEGNTGRACRLLGRPYRIHGKVIHGEHRGRTIGFPTANLTMTEPYFIPKTGVYVVRVECRGQVFHGVANLGYKPTFHQEKLDLSIEVHVLNFSGELYGESMAIQFMHYIRPEKKFPNVEALVQQIKEDVQQAEQWIQSQAQVPRCCSVNRD